VALEESEQSRGGRDETKLKCQAQVGEVWINHDRSLSSGRYSNRIGCCGLFKRAAVLVCRRGGAVVIAGLQEDDTAIGCREGVWLLGRRIDGGQIGDAEPGDAKRINLLGRGGCSDRIGCCRLFKAAAVLLCRGGGGGDRAAAPRRGAGGGAPTEDHPRASASSIKVSRSPSRARLAGPSSFRPGQKRRRHRRRVRNEESELARLQKAADQDQERSERIDWE
jgi:hypothetical protein